MRTRKRPIRSLLCCSTRTRKLRSNNRQSEAAENLGLSRYENKKETQRSLLCCSTRTRKLRSNNRQSKAAENLGLSRYENKKETQRSLLCCSTRTRTQTDRTRICSATITPLSRGAFDIFSKAAKRRFSRSTSALDQKRVQKYCFFLTCANFSAFFLKKLAYLGIFL